MPWWWSSENRGDDTTGTSTTKSATTPPQTAESPVAILDKPRQNAPPTEDGQITQLLYGFSESPSQPAAEEGTATSPPDGPPSGPPQSSIAPFPETMSCRQAFDDAFYCQSLGGQFHNIYRYGTLRDCRENWSQFWFCMRNRGKSEEVKRANIRAWYARREEKYVTGPSSCDVWEERTPAERVQRAFHRDPEEDGVLERRSVLRY